MSVNKTFIPSTNLIQKINNHIILTENYQSHKLHQYFLKEISILPKHRYSVTLSNWLLNNND